jgi:septum site-determining protein MinD
MPTPSAQENTPLTEIIVVTSGKGGVGKTTTSASLAVGLARRGKKVAVIDFDVGLRNLDLIMGCERRVVYDFVNVIQGECTLKQALIKDKRIDSLYVLAASQTRDKDALSKEGVERVLNELAEDGFDYVICDSPAGIEKGASLAMYFADRAIVVVNPEVSSVRDSDRILGLLSSKTRRAELGNGGVEQHLLLTRYNPERVASGDMMGIADVKDILGIEVIGVIPESPGVLSASNAGVPVILDDASEAGQAYADAVARLSGETRPMRFTEAQKKGLLARIFGS